MEQGSARVFLGSKVPHSSLVPLETSVVEKPVERGLIKKVSSLRASST